MGRGTRRLRPLAAFLAAAVTAGCAGEKDRAPDVLMDGSRAREVPVELEGIGKPAVLTKVRAVRVADIRPGTPAGSCLDGRRHRGLRATGWSVERVAVASESVTFREESGRGLFGCDNSLGPREGNRRWCGGAYGLLYEGRLRDPRLDLICNSREGRPLGFAWVESISTARYIVVEHESYAEVYEVAGGLPARVATTEGVRVEGSRASFALTEHGARGRLLRRYRLETVAAG